MRQRTWNFAGNPALSLFGYAVLAFVLAISLFPILWVLVSSLKTPRELFNNPFSLPRNLYLDGYAYILGSTPLVTSFRNSLLVAGAGTVLNLAIVGCAAYAIARYRFRYKALLQALFGATLFLPVIALSYPVVLSARAVHLDNSLLGLTLVYAGTSLGTTFFILRGYFLNIPKEMEESAMIEGAGYLRTFVSIILPLSRSGLSAAAILQFLALWNEFYFALILINDEDLKTMPLLASGLQASFTLNLTPLFAAIVCIILPTILLFALTSKLVVDSLAAGALKE